MVGQVLSRMSLSSESDEPESADSPPANIRRTLRKLNIRPLTSAFVQRHTKQQLFWARSPTGLLLSVIQSAAGTLSYIGGWLSLISGISYLLVQFDGIPLDVVCLVALIATLVATFVHIAVSGYLAEAKDARWRYLPLPSYPHPLPTPIADMISLIRQHCPEAQFRIVVLEANSRQSHAMLRVEDQQSFGFFLEAWQISSPDPALK